MVADNVAEGVMILSRDELAHAYVLADRERHEAGRAVSRLLRNTADARDPSKAVANARAIGAALERERKAWDAFRSARQALDEAYEAAAAF